MPNEGFNPDPSRLGTVEDVNGASITVKLSDTTPGGLVFVNGQSYRVGQVGGFVRIPAGYVDLYGIISQVGAGAAPGRPELGPHLGSRWLRIELVGEGRRGSKFERGISQYPSIGDPAHIVTENELQMVYSSSQDDSHVPIGRVASAESIRAYLDLNRLVSRHSAIVGSTGAGKSNAVATIISAIADPNRFASARIVLFDLHGEYTKAFGALAKVFRIGADKAKGEHELQVPFWSLNADEFISLAMGSVAGPPLAILQEKILIQKRSSKPAGAAHSLPDHSITVDTPLPFCAYKLWHELYSIHCATHTVSGNQNQTEATRAYMEAGTPPAKMAGDPYTLVRPVFMPENKEASATKIYVGQHASVPRGHVEVYEGRLRDPRFQFLFNPGKWSVKKDGTTTEDLDSLLKHWIGGERPISVFDLSGIPSSIVDDLVGSVLRILYDSLFWGRSKPEGGRLRPLLIVLEEAHLYLSSKATSRAATATRRIAKEGRKYGVGLMLVSQRPSELDSTILSQCGTITSLRLTNEVDRGQITSCSSDNLKGLFSMLPILKTGEALIVGEAVNMPVRAVIDRPSEGRRPASDDPFVVVPKNPDGSRLQPGGWTEAPKHEDYKPLVKAWRTLDPNAGTEASPTTAPK